MTTKSEHPARIVVGVDDSPQSVAALRWAAVHAGRSGAELHLVHAWELNASAMYGTTVALREEIVHDARTSLTRLASDVLGSPASGSWRLEIVEGPIGPTLVDRAEKAGLLVLGTGEHTGLRRLAAGSVSHYCLSHARCPVVAVPAAPVTAKNPESSFVDEPTSMSPS